MVMPLEAVQLYDVVLNILNSPSCKKIDFKIGLHHINSTGFALVIGAIAAGVESKGGAGLKIQVGGVSSGAGASYYPDTNTLAFPKWFDVGKDPYERSEMVHECVHAMLDMAGNTNGLKSSTNSMDEAAAYIAGLLYYAYESGRDYVATPDDPPVFAAAQKVAAKIRGKAGARVSQEDALAVRKAWVASYGPGVKSLTKGSNTNGVW